MKKPIQFAVEGGGELTFNKVPEVVRRIIKAAEKLPDGKCRPRMLMADHVRVSRGHFRNYATHPALADYRFKDSDGKLYFANPKTIKALNERKASYEAER